MEQPTVSDDEIEDLLLALDRVNTPLCATAAICIRELKARRDELQNTIDEIAGMK